MTMAKPIGCAAPSLFLRGVEMSFCHSAHTSSPRQVIPLPEVTGRRNHGKYMGLSNYELTFCKSKSTLSKVKTITLVFKSVNCEIKRSSGCQSTHPPTLPGSNAGVWERGRGSGQQLRHQLACRPAPARTGLPFVSPFKE